MSSPPIAGVHETDCCVVGGGPAGLMLTLLLARQGIRVTLLEAHHDFDREFRGDSLHPAILNILDEIGLAERLLKLRHFKVFGVNLRSASGRITTLDFRRLGLKYPFIMFIHQVIFLDFLAEEIRKYPSAQILLGANVQELVQEGTVVRGVRYRTEDAWCEVRAKLTVAADGRFSMIRRLAGDQPVRLGPPFELLWFRLPRLPSDAEAFADVQPLAGSRFSAQMIVEGYPTKSIGVFLRSGRQRLMPVFDRFDHWQLGYFFPPGAYSELKAQGVEAMRQNIVNLEPRFAEHVKTIKEWRDFCPLSVAMSRCRRWYRPGLLLIGDAAHTMTPFAGAGIKYAIEDAVVAANVLAGPLRSGQVLIRDLAEVQRQRIWPTRVIQALGVFAQKRVVGGILQSRPRVPAWLPVLGRLRLFQWLFTRMVAVGLWQVHVQSKSDA